MAEGDAHRREHLAEAISTEVHRPDFGLRVIIVFKLVKAVLLVAVAVGAFSLIHRDLHALGVRAVVWLRIAPGNHRVERALARLTGVRPSRLAALGCGALIYAGVLLVEAWGLHRRRVWAEWLTIIVTSSLIPLELYELHHPSLGKVIALVVNIVIVIYLARHRFLFVPGRIGRWLAARLRRR
jgi:uncharacterized membrane protein (DUF2068 family)